MQCVAFVDIGRGPKSHIVDNIISRFARLQDDTSTTIPMATATVSLPTAQPDISYTPDFDKYQARTQRRLVTEKLDLQSLPVGFPSKLESDFVWDGESITGNYEWVYKLSEKEIAEVEDALAHFKC